MSHQFARSDRSMSLETELLCSIDAFHHSLCKGLQLLHRLALLYATLATQTMQATRTVRWVQILPLADSLVAPSDGMRVTSMAHV